MTALYRVAFSGGSLVSELGPASDVTSFFCVHMRICNSITSSIFVDFFDALDQAQKAHEVVSDYFLANGF